MIDINKNACGAFVDFYNMVYADRQKYSKYGAGYSVLSVKIRNNAILDKRFFENIIEIKEAQSTLSKFEAYL